MQVPHTKVIIFEVHLMSLHHVFLSWDTECLTPADIVLLQSSDQVMLAVSKQ